MHLNVIPVAACFCGGPAAVPQAQNPAGLEMSHATKANQYELFLCIQRLRSEQPANKAVLNRPPFTAV